jgi:hypothetical protein
MKYLKEYKEIDFSEDWEEDDDSYNEETLNKIKNIIDKKIPGYYFFKINLHRDRDYYDKIISLYPKKLDRWLTPISIKSKSMICKESFFSSIKIVDDDIKIGWMPDYNLSRISWHYINTDNGYVWYLESGYKYLGEI